MDFSPSNGLIGLAERPLDAVLFRSAAGARTTADFIRDAQACAAALPDGEHMVNCCQDRYRFAVGFAAALLRGQVSLLTGDHSPRALRALAARFARVHSISDDASFASPLPHSCVTLGRGSAGPVRVPGVAAGQIAAIVFTSGSTGEPAGTEKSVGELAARSAAAGARFGFTEAAPVTMIGTVPPNHMYGLETTVLLPLHAAAGSWRDPVFYPGDLAEALDAVPGRRVLVTTPLQLRAMLQMARPARPPCMVISATAPLEAPLAAEAEARWDTELFEIFGATEVGSIASRRTTAGADWSLYPGVTMAGEDAPLVAAPGAPSRRVGDVVALHAGGRHFRLVGRCGDMVKLGGRRASLSGLTRLLTQIDGVQDGVFVAPDDLDRRPTARLFALVVAPGRPHEDIMEALRGQIDPVFLPRPLLRVDALPRNALGKLPREALLALAGTCARPPRRERVA